MYPNHHSASEGGKAPTRVCTKQAHQISGQLPMLGRPATLVLIDDRTTRITPLFYRKASFEGGLASTASAKRTNSQETVAVGPVEAILLTLDGDMVAVEVCAHRNWTFQARFRTDSLPHLHLLIRILQHYHLSSASASCITVYFPAKAKLVPIRTDSQRLYARRASPPL